MLRHRIPFSPLSSIPAPGGDGTKGTFWHSPLDSRSTSEYVRILASHFFLVFLSTWLVMFSSLFIGAIFGDVTAVTPPTIGIYAALVGLLHVPPLYIAFNARTWDRLDVRINPYISLAECLGHHAIGFIPCVVELVAQALGTVVATAFAYGVLADSPTFSAGFGSPIVNTGVGWAFFLELFSMLYVSWIYFHNWYHDQSPQMPITMAYIIGGTAAIVYPFIGATTHNPFRWLAACTLEGTCGAAGSWIYPVGPLVGAAVGFLFHLGTQYIK